MLTSDRSHNGELAQANGVGLSNCTGSGRYSSLGFYDCKTSVLRPKIIKGRAALVLLPHTIHCLTLLLFLRGLGRTIT